MSDAPLTLSAHGLVRRFGKQNVVDGVSVQLRRGEILGLLGQNGAGKSTTLQMLAGVLAPHAGRIEVCGFDLARQPTLAKAHIGFLPEIPPLYRDMRVDGYLQYVAQLRGMLHPEIPAALTDTKQRCGLIDIGKMIIGTLSKGYQQRVGIAQAIIHNPEVIILDEPTVGLDPVQLHDIRELIRELGDAHSVILSTHLLGEVEKICDRVEIMHQGRLIYANSNAGMMQYGNGRMSLEEVFMQITETTSTAERAQ
jgi:ABC-2 type transport system ATP-binding protein